MRAYQLLVTEVNRYELAKEGVDKERTTWPYRPPVLTHVCKREWVPSERLQASPLRRTARSLLTNAKSSRTPYFEALDQNRKGQHLLCRNAPSALYPGNPRNRPVIRLRKTNHSLIAKLSSEQIAMEAPLAR